MATITTTTPSQSGPSMPSMDDFTGEEDTTDLFNEFNRYINNSSGSGGGGNSGSSGNDNNAQQPSLPQQPTPPQSSASSPTSSLPQSTAAAAASIIPNTATKTTAVAAAWNLPSKTTDNLDGKKQRGKSNGSGVGVNRRRGGKMDILTDDGNDRTTTIGDGDNAKARPNGGSGFTISDLIYYDLCGRTRTFHELVYFTASYETLTREERRRIIALVKDSLRSAEKAICNGRVTRRPVRDIVRALCYGARLNVDLMRELTLRRLQHMGLQGLTTIHITDKLMIKNIDLWYDYASIDTCEWLNMGILSEDMQRMLQLNEPLKGRGCRACIHALLRLCRNGICLELGRAADGNGGQFVATATANAPQVNNAPPVNNNNSNDFGFGYDQITAVAATATNATVKRKRNGGSNKTIATMPKKRGAAIVSAAAAAAAAATAGPSRIDAGTTAPQKRKSANSLTTSSSKRAKIIQSRQQQQIPQQQPFTKPLTSITTRQQLQQQQTVEPPMLPALSTQQPFLQQQHPWTNLPPPPQQYSSQSTTVSSQQLPPPRMISAGRKDINKDISPSSPMSYEDEYSTEEDDMDEEAARINGDDGDSNVPFSGVSFNTDNLPKK